MTALAQLAQLGVRPSGLSSDSRRVRPGEAFVAYRGEHADGRAYIAQAIANGAAAVIWESGDFSWDTSWALPQVAVAQLRANVGEIASEFYGDPSARLWMIGITGTNGKTSCSHWLAQALTQLGRKTAVLGTLGNGFPGALTEAINTTPDPILLHGVLADYCAQGATGVAMEVSSHGLDQGRVNGVRFDVAVFTNLTRDHLDYHGDMAAYRAAKRRLFDWPSLRYAVLNADDAVGADIARQLAHQGMPVLTYGLDAGQVRGRNLVLDERGLRMTAHTPEGEADLHLPLMGRFNAYNLLAVLAALLASQIALQDAVTALQALRPVAGRMQLLGGGTRPRVVVDYAHTPDALEKALTSLREQTSGQLICVFGCGGNRDKGKRPLMGSAAARLADRVVVTSDNPRHEDAHAIIDDIVAGAAGDIVIEVDRAAAISRAIAEAQPGDVVLIAGKGHEAYQMIGNEKLPFSDAEVAARALS